MCSECDSYFAHIAESFDATLADYRRDCANGKMRDTPGMRCSDNAGMYTELCDEMEGGTDLLAWYLAVAIERLTALEMCGVPT